MMPCLWIYKLHYQCRRTRIGNLSNQNQLPGLGISFSCHNFTVCKGPVSTPRPDPNMKRLLNIFLLISFLFGYMEWGKGYNEFVFQAEADIFSKSLNNLSSLLHPLILLPLAGQLILIYTAFLKQPPRFLSFLALACLSTIMLFIFFIGLLAPNFRILASTIPFMVTGALILKYNWKK